MPNRRLKKKTPFCYFAVPDDDMTHVKIEGSVLEGMYWKRRMEAVCAQYKRWRHYIKTRRVHEKPAKRKRHYSEGRGEHFDSCRDEPPLKAQRSQTPKNTSTEHFDIDDFENVFTDSLFDSLNQPYMFPNPREFVQSGNADIMQPGLLSLQPSLEEIMASLERYVDEPCSSSRDSSMALIPASQSLAPPSQSPQQISMTPLPRPTANSVPRSAPSSRPAQDYAVASMLVDYSNQTSVPMPTRQSSSITSQMLMMSAQGAQPQYSTAMYDQRTWKGTSLLLGGSDSVSNSLEYMPQFLQSQTNIMSGSALSSVAPPPRSWWLESSLPSAHSPLVASASLGASTPLGPATPLGVGIGSSTPPSLLRTELRSPVVRSVQDLSRLPDSLLTINRASSISKQPSALTHRLEQPMLTVEKEERLFTAPPLKHDWSSIRSVVGGTGGAASPIVQNRSAPPTADVRSNDSSNPWKLTVLEAPIYSHALFSSTASRIGDEPMTSSGHSTQDMVNMGAGPSEKCDPVLKEEPLLLSAPASVKTARGSSRQVQADSTMHPEERKRILHLHAEQNRRSALKDGFDQLMDMIPDLYSGGVKPTNAVVLAKAAEHIRRLNAGKEEQMVGKAVLQDKISRLNQRISSLQSNLPSASGVTSTKMEPRAALESFFDRYTKERSKKDFRFWVMSRMLQPIAVGQSSSFASQIAPEGSSREEVAASCSDWLNTHWRAAELRPLASTLLVHLATNTNVLTNPESLEGYVHEQLKNLV